jgi:hypothetical protein
MPDVAAMPAPVPRALGGAAAIIGAGAVALSAYPEAWRQSLAGAIPTAVFGMALLFVEVWGLARVLLPRETEHYDDLLDEAHAAFRSARARGKADGVPGTIGKEPATAFAQWLRTEMTVLVAEDPAEGVVGTIALSAVGTGEGHLRGLAVRRDVSERARRRRGQIIPASSSASRRPRRTWAPANSATSCATGGSGRTERGREPAPTRIYRIARAWGPAVALGFSPAQTSA